MIRRPPELERLASISGYSNIPVEFASTANRIYGRTRADLSPEYRNSSELDYYLETANRLFRSSHPFVFGEQAKYAFFYGKSVAMGKQLSGLEPNRRLLNVLKRGSNKFEAYTLRESLFNQWSSVISEEQRTKPLTPQYALDITGYYLFLRKHLRQGLHFDPTLKDLQLVPGFLEEYFADPSHVRDAVLNAA